MDTSSVHASHFALLVIESRWHSLLLRLHDSLELSDDSLERRQPLLQLLVDVGLWRTELGIERSAIRASLHRELERLDVSASYRKL